MGPVRIARVVRRWLHLACAVAALLVMVSPLALGAAMNPVLRELAGAPEHQCKCSMGPGKCGCPACVKLDQERASERRQPAPCLRGTCDLDGPAMTFGAPTLAVLGAVSSGLPVPAVARLGMGDLAQAPPVTTNEPPVPPPRIASI